MISLNPRIILYINRLRLIGPCLGLAVVLIFFGFIRIRLLDFPLERDEGEYAYMGQLILKGLAPYQFCHTMKLPGTAALYALFMIILGQSPAAIHAGLLLVNSLTIICLYFLTRRLFDPLAGLIAASCFGLLSLEPSLYGFAAHATHFVILFAIAGIWLLLKSIESQKYLSFLSSGLLLGLAFLMKQPGIFFLFFALAYVIYSERKGLKHWRTIHLHLAILLTGAFIPFALVCLYLFAIGGFDSFLFWTFDYALIYGTLFSYTQGMMYLTASFLHIIQDALLLWLLSLSGAGLLFYVQNTRRYAVFLIGFTLLSFAAVSVGFYFSVHYYILLLPAVSLLCAAAVTAVASLLCRFSKTSTSTPFATGLFILALFTGILTQKDFFFKISPITSSRSIYQGNPFADAPQIAYYLKSHSTEKDTIAILGSEPEIYFLSDRRSATGYIYMYPLMEAQPYASHMQKDMASEISLTQPLFLVFVSSAASWSHHDDSDPMIITWATKYAHDHYQLVAIADVYKNNTHFRWDVAPGAEPTSPLNILLWKRKS